MSGIPGREHSLGIGVEDGQLLALAGTGGEGGGGLTGRGCSPLEPYPALWGGPFKPWVLRWNGWGPPASLASAFLTELPRQRQGGGRGLWVVALRCILPQNRACAAARISGAVSACCLLEREVGEIIVSPREEIWA